MIQTLQSDSNNAFAHVKREIKGLMDFNGEVDRDDVIYTANRLAAVLRMVHDNFQSWSDEAIREFVLGKNDPLKNIDFMPDQFNQMVRKIQQDIIVQFSDDKAVFQHRRNAPGLSVSHLAA